MQICFATYSNYNAYLICEIYTYLVKNTELQILNVICAKVIISYPIAVITEDIKR
jgi:hypothetical protein